MDSMWSCDLAQARFLLGEACWSPPGLGLRAVVMRAAGLDYTLELQEARSDESCPETFGLATELLLDRHGEPDWGYFQLGMLLEFVEAQAWGTPQVVLDAIERFARGFRGNRWLKIAGGPKARFLAAAFQARVLLDREVALEIGCFAGYTMIRLADAGAHVVSWEVDPVHACLARHMAGLARPAGAVEVWVGNSNDLPPRLTEDFGSYSMGFIFMDHRGTRFHTDLHAIEALSIPGVRARCVADNVLTPGAPIFAWEVACTARKLGPCAAALYAVPEFLQGDLVDWVAVCDVHAEPMSRFPRSPEAPASLHRLAWQTDQKRWEGHGGAARVEQRLNMAKLAREVLMAAGVEAIPWHDHH